MAKFENSTFENVKVYVDDNEYKGCKFIQCNIVFTGTGALSLVENTFTDCRFSFEGPAARTLEFMTALYTGGARQLIEGTFDKIRGKGKPSIGTK